MICFFVTDFLRMMGARPGLAKEPLIPFNVQKWTFCLIGFPSSINDDFKRGVLRETTPSSMAASRFKYNTKQLRKIELSSSQWLLYWLLVQEVTGSNLIFLRCIYSFVSLLRALFVRPYTENIGRRHFFGGSSAACS